MLKLNKNVHKLKWYVLFRGYAKSASITAEKPAKKLFTPEEFANLEPIDYNLAKTTAADLTFHFYQNKTKSPVIVSNRLDFELDRDLPTKFLIHGYRTNHTSPWMTIVQRQYALQSPHNIFIADWSQPANQAYRISGANTLPIGRYAADFILSTGIALNRIHLIGHSLGAHLAGFIGKSLRLKTGKKLARITVLDAAGPAFDRLTDDNLHVCRHDADFVDAYHTDIDYFGYKQPLGHVDFYPNGGKNQPGCDRHVDVICNHFRSTVLFIESFKKPTIRAKPAKYSGGERVEIVGDAAETIGFGAGLNGRERGVFYVETADRPPFFS